jgi:pSer/pThr/pTyr-binding forkhead associated (FHA) protein
MRLCLNVRLPQGSFAFEHAGPVVRVGRDPDCELALPDETSQVSRRHAQIELTPAGAFVTDLGSSNGTFVNEQRLSRRTPVQPGSRIQLGYTGPVLEVREVELATSRPAPPPLPAATVLVPQPARPPAPPRPAAPAQPVPWLLVGAGAAGAGVLLLVLGAVWWRSVGRPPTEPVAAVTPAAAKSEAEVKGSALPPAPDVAKAAPEKSRPEGKRPPAPREDKPAAAEMPSLESRPVGIYVAGDKGPPSVLVQRQRDPDPWARLRPDERVATARYLLSLPGYRSRILLDSGVELHLWGNVPEMSPHPPVLESGVVLQAPAPDLALDFTLDRGRVWLASARGRKEPVRVRARFHREVWDLSWPDDATEVVLELWGAYPPEVPYRPEPGGPGPKAWAGLFVRGRATLTARGRTVDLPDRATVVWSSSGRDWEGPRVLPQLPPWWSEKLDPKRSPLLADAMGALDELSRLLAARDKKADKTASPEAGGPGDVREVVETIRYQAREAPERPDRVLAVLCLAALDALPPLLEALDEARPEYPEVRGAAAFALQRWLSHHADNAAELVRVLQEKRGYPREKALLILELLHELPADAAARPETYQRLLDYLEHEERVIRQLAHGHLVRLVPAGRTIPYDAAKSADDRKPAVAKWRELIPPGTLPARAAPPTGGE